MVNKVNINLMVSAVFTADLGCPGEGRLSSLTKHIYRPSLCLLRRCSVDSSIFSTDLPCTVAFQTATQSQYHSRGCPSSMIDGDHRWAERMSAARFGPLIRSSFRHSGENAYTYTRACLTCAWRFPLRKLGSQCGLRLPCT